MERLLRLAGEMILVPALLVHVPLGALAPAARAQAPEEALDAAVARIDTARDRIETALAETEIETDLAASLQAALLALEDAQWEIERAGLLALMAEAEREAEADQPPPGPTDEDWQAAIPRATRYGRPDRTSEGDLHDGSHYDQSSDDRTYRAYCDGDPERVGIAGFAWNIRSNTEAIHWRWPSGGPSGGEPWRAWFSGQPLGAVGEQIVRVADTEVEWYEYAPPRRNWESEFVILFACSLPGVEEMELHYHH